MFPGPLSIPLGPFQFFSKIHRDFREWMFISGVNGTGDKWEKCWATHLFHILLRAYLSALYTCRLNFCFFFIYRSRQASFVKTISNQNGDISSPRSRTRPPIVSFEPPWKDAPIDTPHTRITGVVVTGNKFIADVIVTGGRGHLFMKNPEVENLVSDSL